MPLLEIELAVAEGGQGRIVGDGDKGAAILAREAEQQVDDGCSSGGIQIARRLVGKEDAGVIDQRAGNGDALLLAAAELGGKVIETAREADAVEQVAGLGFASLIPGAAEHGGEKDIFQGGQFGQQEVGLEDKTHPAIAQISLLVAAKGEELFSLELDRACARTFQARKDVEQGRFSRTGGTAQEDHFAPGNIEIDSPEHLEMFPSQIIGLMEPPGSEMDVGVVHER